MIGQVELNNQKTNLRESVDRTMGEPKYLLHHVQNNRWLIVSREGALREMDTGLYDGWRGPFDEAQVVSQKHEVNNELDQRRHQTEPTFNRTREDIQEQIIRVRKQFKLGL